MAIQTYEDFVEIHGILLASAGLPPSLYPKLYEKLVHDVLDGGRAFRIELCEGGRQRRLLLSCENLMKESDVFLVDHAWSFRLADARKQLEEIPGLVERMAKLMCVVDDLNDVLDDGSPEDKRESKKNNAEQFVNEIVLKAKNGGKDVLWLELDELDIDDVQLKSLQIPARFPNLVGLSLWGNLLESVGIVLEAVTGLHSLRGLWVNGNPVASNQNLMNSIADVLPSLEIYNSKLLEDFGRWAVGFCSGILGPNNPCGTENPNVLKETEEVDLSDRDIRRLPTKGLNHIELPMLTNLNLRGNPLDKVSRSDLLQFLTSFPLLESLEIDIPGPLGSSAMRIVEEIPKLVNLNGVSVTEVLNDEKEIVDGNLRPRFPPWSPKEPLVERVLRAMWSYMMTYRLADEEKLDETPIWYIMDELGSALRHSDEPNIVVAPFMFMPDGTLSSAISYTLLWPIKDIMEGNECTRDYLVGVGEEKQRSARLTAWFHTPSAYFEQAYSAHHKVNAAAQRNPVSKTTATRSILPSDGRPITVYCDIPQVCDFLNRPEFSLIDDPSKADIVWASWQIDEEARQSLGLQAHQYINQFPFEACLVMKHHLAETIRQACGSPNWLPTTYNLECQLAALIGDYNAREERGDDNMWIIKPWNMARTIDTDITTYLPAIIRHLETGPKICQKYIERPALFRGKKFDLRYIVLLRSLQPLELFLCDIFWARLALNEYTTEERSLSEYETHFTVMNYRNKLNHISTHDFVPEFEKEHDVKWPEIHERIRTMLRAVFESAYAVHPEMHSSMSRAIYGVDVMLDSTFQPKLLEVTYCPDCTRACKYDAKKVLGEGVMRGVNFFNVVFGCLFLNETQDVTTLDAV